MIISEKRDQRKSITDISVGRTFRCASGVFWMKTDIDGTSKSMLCVNLEDGTTRYFPRTALITLADLRAEEI